jgi:hypothetical protein
MPDGSGEKSPQNTADGGTADLQAPRDLGFADAGTMQLPYLVGVETCGGGPAEPLTFLTSMRQSGLNALAEDVALKLDKHGPADRPSLVPRESADENGYSSRPGAL